MEISHDFSPDGAADPVRGRLEQLEAQLALTQKALGHDLPNQMVAVQGLARMLALELGTDAPPDSRDVLARLGALARLAAEHMRALAALGRLGQQPGPAETFDLGELAREAATEAKVLCKGSAVDYHFLHGMPVVTASRAPLYQLLLQLLRNALQAAAPGRILVVTVGAGRAETGGVELWVEDDGRGMGEFHLNQVRAALAGAAGAGPGFGLVLVRQVVAGWCGAVRVRSEPDRGTRVTVLARTLQEGPGTVS